MTPEGESAIAGLLAGLPEAQGVLCGSDRVGPADAAGSLVGGIRVLGDREPGSRGAIPDRRPEQSARRERRGEGHRSVGQSRTSRRRRYSDSPSTASNASCRCRRRRPSTPPHSPTNNASRRASSCWRRARRDALDALDQSALVRGILGDESVDAVVAVRRYEQENFGDLSPDELAEKFRLAWSV